MFKRSGNTLIIKEEVSNTTPYYQMADIFLFPTTNEGMSNVILEAMCQGCACIACDYKGRQKEIIENSDEGLICSPDNAISLANFLTVLIVNEEKRNKLQKNAIKRSLNFNLDSIMKMWDIILTISKKGNGK